MNKRLDPEIEAYRVRAEARGLERFSVALKESDLAIACTHARQEEARSALALLRQQLETYIEAHPAFLRSLEPVAVHARAPLIVKAMAEAARAAGVGPMAAVAGALAEAVGRRLLAVSPEVIVENGGDLFCAVRRPRTVALDGGNSPFSYKLGLCLRPEAGPLGVCTSSGTVGGSLSFGRADAACIVAASAALADAAATAVGNVVHSPDDVEVGLARAAEIPGVLGAVVAAGERLGVWGEVELVELQ